MQKLQIDACHFSNKVKGTMGLEPTTTGINWGSTNRATLTMTPGLNTKNKDSQAVIRLNNWAA